MHSTDISSVRTSQKSDAGLSCKNLSRQISGKWIWSKINLHLAPGDKLALSGSSGSGKSLLLRTLAGLDVIESGLSGETGTINFDGISLHDWEMPEYRTKVSYIPQNPVFFDETVETNLKRAFQLKAHQHRRYDQKQILAWLEQFSLLTAAGNSSGVGDYSEFLQRPAKDLSGGGAQITALLRVLQLEPQVLLLDEPTASLDTVLTGRFEYLLEKWQKELPDSNSDTANTKPQRAWIWVSHNPDQLQRMCRNMFSLESENGN
jgi:putative ABC transport system ATP-binding protein